MHTVALSSSDGQFNISVSGDDTELIASMLLLMEIPREVADITLDDVAQRRFQRRHNTPTTLAAPAA